VHTCAKFEVDSIICSKVIRGSQNFEFWSRDPDDVQLGVDLGSVPRRGLSCISVSNLKRIAIFVQKLLGVPKFRILVT